MQKICLALAFTIVLFLVFSFPASAQYGCTNFIPCGKHSCPNGINTVDYQCCPNCDQPAVCQDLGLCPGDPGSCTTDANCFPTNPYCPAGYCGEIHCVNNACVSTCKPPSQCVTQASPTPGASPSPADPPTCSISGATTIQAGQMGGWSATTVVPSGDKAHIQMQRNTSKVVSTATTINYSTCGDLSNTCTITGSWTPTTADIGTHYVFCRGYNDALRECRPFDYGAYPADVDCDGVTDSACPDADCLVVTVTPIGPWLQTVGGDVHGNTNVGTLLP